MKSLFRFLACFLTFLLVLPCAYAYAPYANPECVIYGGTVVQIQPTDAVVTCQNPQGQAQIIYMPLSPSVGQEVTITDGNGTAGTVPLTIYPYNAVGTINGSPSYVLNTNYESVTLCFQQYGWIPISTGLPYRTLSALSIANNTVLGNVSGGVSPPQALNLAQLTALINVFTPTLKGLVPASGGGTTSFLRADGTFAAPATSYVTSVSGTANQVTVTPTTGASVVSLPSAITLPGTLTAGGAFTMGGYGISGTGTVAPNASGAYDLGSTTLPYRNIYITDNTDTTYYQYIVQAALTGNHILTVPNADSNTIQPLASATANKVVQFIDSTGTQQLVQLAFSNLSGTVSAAQSLALTSGFTYIGNGSNQPAAATMTTLTADLNVATNLLQGLVPPLTDAQIVVGKSSSAIQAVTMSGDVTITNAGVTALKNTGSGAGSATNSSVTVDAQGRVTAYSSGQAGYGGNGADGAGTITTSSLAGPFQKNYTSMSLANGQTWTLGGAANESPCIINAQGTINIAGTITCTAGSGGAGGVGGATNNQVSSGNGSGLGGGGGGIGVNGQCNGAGGGGGSGGGGGIGGYATNGGGGTAGSPYFSSLSGGSGGGGGSGLSTAIGGNGGMTVIFCSVGTITLASTAVITDNASAGSSTTTQFNCAGGGGGGGIGWFISQASITFTSGATLTFNGGAGGNASGGNNGAGGGGGGGHAIAWCPAGQFTNASTNTFTGGAAGTGGVGTPTASSAGLLTSISGTPNLPLMCWLGLVKPTNVCEARTYGDGIAYMAKRERAARQANPQVAEITINQRDMAREYAHGDLNLYAKALTSGWDAEATCLNDSAEALRNAA